MASTSPNASPALEHTIPHALLGDAGAHLAHLRALRHPALVPLADAAIDERGLHLTWQAPPGEPLAEHVASGPIAAVDAIDLAHDLLLGLEHAHKAGLVHLGLSPAHVFLDGSLAGRLTARVCGLGLPLGGARTVADDLRDVGALIYLALTGLTPGVVGDPEHPLLPLETARPEVMVDAAIEHALMRALGVETPAFESASEMAEALKIRQTRTGHTRRPAATAPQVPRAVRSELLAITDLNLLPTARDSDARAPAPPPTSTGRSRRWPWLVVVAVAAVLLLLLVWSATSGDEGSVPAAELAKPTQADPTAAEAVTTPEPRPGPTAIEATTAEPPTAPPDATPTATARVEPTDASAAANAPDAQDPPELVDARGPTEPDAATPEPSDASAPADAAPPAPSATLTCRLTTNPPGAKVLRGREVLGTTPLELSLARSELPMTLIFALPGHLRLERVVPVSDGNLIELSVELPARATARPARKPDAPPATRPDKTPPPILLGR